MNFVTIFIFQRNHTICLDHILDHLLSKANWIHYFWWDQRIASAIHLLSAWMWVFSWASRNICSPQVYDFILGPRRSSYRVSFYTKYICGHYMLLVSSTAYKFFGNEFQQMRKRLEILYSSMRTTNWCILIPARIEISAYPLQFHEW